MLGCHNEEKISRLTDGRIRVSVVVEKPFVNASAEADKYIALAKQKGKILTVYHSKFSCQTICHVFATCIKTNKICKTPDRRFDSDFRTLQVLLNESALGEVLEAEIHYDFPNAGWIYGWTEKEYTPGKGMLFGLGK